MTMNRRTFLRSADCARVVERIAGADGYATGVALAERAIREAPSPTTSSSSPAPGLPTRSLPGPPAGSAARCSWPSGEAHRGQRRQGVPHPVRSDEFFWIRPVGGSAALPAAFASELTPLLRARRTRTTP